MSLEVSRFCCVGVERLVLLSFVVSWRIRNKFDEFSELFEEFLDRIFKVLFSDFWSR